MFQKIAIAAALVVASSTAIAGDATNYYVGGDIGTTKGEDSSDRETGFGVFGGYHFNQYIAIEAGVRRLVDADETFGGVTYNDRIDQLSVSAVGTIPLGHGFSVFGRLGANRINLKVSGGAISGQDHKNRGLYGIGAAYSFTPAITARVELQKPMSEMTNLSAGVSYSF